MHSFKTHILLTEAYDRNRTWDNYKDQILDRVSKPLYWQRTKGSGVRSGVERLSHEQYNQLLPGGIAPSFKPVWDDHALLTMYRSEPKLNTTGGGYAPEGQGWDDGTHGQTGAEHKLEDLKQNLLLHFENAVPHPKYIPTLMRMYASGNLKRLEDVQSRGEEAIKRYHRLSTHGKLKGTDVIYNHDPIRGPIMQRTNIAETDFKRFRGIEDFEQVNHHHEADFEEMNRKSVADLNKNDYTVVHDDDNVTVYHPHTHEAAIALAYPNDGGDKAHWCTAADSSGGKKNFEQYSKGAPLLIFRPKNPIHKGEMYQANYKAGQFMDENDKRSNFLMPSFSEGKPQRFKNFGMNQLKKYTFQHAYDHPEKYDKETFEDDDDFKRFAKDKVFNGMPEEDYKHYRKVAGHFWNAPDYRTDY